MRTARTKRPEQLAPRVASGSATRRQYKRERNRALRRLWRQLGADAPTRLGYSGWAD